MCYDLITIIGLRVNFILLRNVQNPLFHLDPFDVGKKKKKKTKQNHKEKKDKNIR